MAADHDWPMVKLGDLGRFASGGTPNRKREEFYQGETPWISSADISEDGKITARRFITDEAIAKSATTEVPAGTLLVAVRIGVGKTAITTSPTCFSQDVVALLDTDPNEVSTGFLQHLITWLRPHLEQIARGVTIKGITIGDLKDLNIPLPPLAEQRRIAKILDRSAANLSLVEEMSARVEHARAELFNSMFPIEHYPATTVGNFLSETSYGSSKKASDTGDYPILRMGNITYSGSLTYEDLKYLNLEEADISKHTLQDGDILFNRTNSRELVGKTAVYYGASSSIAYAGYLVRCRTNERALPEFISGYLNSRYGKAYLLQRAKSIVGMSNINAQELRSLTIPDVPIAEQHTYASVYKKLEDLRLQAVDKITALEELHASLSARAFAGTL